MAKGDPLIYLSDYPYLQLVLLILLVYAGYEDFKRRKINTLPFLAINIVLILYYAFTDAWILVFFVPILGEYFLKKYSILLYPLLIVPIFFHFSLITLTLAYSLLLIKLFEVLVRNFGKGDVKVLHAIAVTFPLYHNIQTLYSLFPPVLAVAMIASILGIVAAALNGTKRERAYSVRKFSISPHPALPKDDKFWIDGHKLVYKIPFVTFLMVGYAILLTLSLLRLV